MAYTAKITQKNNEGNRIVVVVEFSNGTTTLSENIIVVSDGDLARKVKGKIKQLEYIESTFDDLIVGGFINTSEPTPTQAELDKNEWQNDFSKLQRLKIAIGLGILNGDEALVTNLRTKIKTNFKPEYINGL